MQLYLKKACVKIKPGNCAELTYFIFVLNFNFTIIAYRQLWK
jgi:hypothetical protein